MRHQSGLKVAPASHQQSSLHWPILLFFYAFLQWSVTAKGAEFQLKDIFSLHCTKASILELEKTL